jgi:glycine/D-amino acid oxidase-like deaminating enzyme
VLHEDSPVAGIEPGRVVTADGEVGCGTVLVCVDGHLDRLLPELAGTVRTVRLQMLATEPLPPRWDRPVYLRGGMEYWQQLQDGRLALGGFRDVGGTEEETHDATPTAPVQDALDRHLRDRLGVTAEVTHRWAASVGYTRSGLPYVGQVRPRVWAAGGYCGTGNLVGALCGRELAAVALGEPAPASGFLAAAAAVGT